MQIFDLYIFILYSLLETVLYVKNNVHVYYIDEIINTNILNTLKM